LAEPADIPESGTLHGEDAVKRQLAGYIAAFDAFHTDPQEIVDLGDQVVVSAVLKGRSRHTG